jgi:hypothetical protein
MKLQMRGEAKNLKLKEKKQRRLRDQLRRLSQEDLNAMIRIGVPAPKAKAKAQPKAKPKAQAAAR